MCPVWQINKTSTNREKRASSPLSLAFRCITNKKTNKQTPLEADCRSDKLVKSGWSCVALLVGGLPSITLSLSLSLFIRSSTISMCLYPPAVAALAAPQPCFYCSVAAPICWPQTSVYSPALEVGCLIIYTFDFTFICWFSSIALRADKQANELWYW